MDQRKEIIQKIAQWKWNRKLPIVDAEREKKVIQHARTIAQKHNVDVAAAVDLVAVLIEENVAYQEELFALWKEQGVDTFGGECAIEQLRKELDAYIERRICALM